MMAETWFVLSRLGRVGIEHKIVGEVRVEYGDGLVDGDGVKAPTIIHWRASMDCQAGVGGEEKAATCDRPIRIGAVGIERRNGLTQQVGKRQHDGHCAGRRPDSASPCHGPSPRLGRGLLLEAVRGMSRIVNTDGSFFHGSPSVDGLELLHEVAGCRGRGGNSIDGVEHGSTDDGMSLNGWMGCSIIVDIAETISEKGISEFWGSVGSEHDARLVARSAERIGVSAVLGRDSTAFDGGHDSPNSVMVAVHPEGNRKEEVGWDSRRVQPSCGRIPWPRGCR
ncbi:MAG: hypothetical protein JXA67_05775 [Micromonosporaceae bacterium]|nr:hypothetical protein [Micromonosporaceae bacterium]